MDQTDDYRAVHTAVHRWYRSHGRDLPWRRPPFAGDPYAVLVSEVMLQQTQVDRVAPKFVAFMAAFPTLDALAGTEAGDVIRMWAGMGYNGRAARLHRLARVVRDAYAGELPRTAQELRRLPGIGPYTAAAVVCFAYGQAEPVLDTNVYRVLSRLVHGVEAPSRKAIEPLARELLPADGHPLSASAWHQAVMDIGATICTAAKPRCMLCPLRPHCAAAPLLQDGAARGLAEASVPYTPKQGAFASSSRYYRGRIVDILRPLPPGVGMSLGELGPAVDASFDGERDLGWLEGLLEGLARDGLVSVQSGRAALP